MIEGLAQVSLLEQAKAQAEMSIFVYSVTGKQPTKERLGHHVLALAQSALGAASCLIVRLLRQRHSRGRQDEDDKAYSKRDRPTGRCSVHSLFRLTESHGGFT